MSRTTQYIGLTDAAKDFLKKNNFEVFDGEKNNTTGMFEEDVPLGIWWGKIPNCDRPLDVSEKVIVREKLQCSPWSSGPMLFTCLEIDWGNGAKIQCFQWIDDPTITNEVDYKNGRMWV